MFVRMSACGQVLLYPKCKVREFQVVCACGLDQRLILGYIGAESMAKIFYFPLELCPSVYSGFTAGAGALVATR